MKITLVISMLISLSLQGFATMNNESQQSHFPGTIVAREQGGANNTRLILPLKRTTVTLEVSGNVLRAEVAQTFTNDTDVTLEAAYIFPLPTNSTVLDMTLEFDDSIVRSVVKEKREAKATYDKAKAEGKKTALLDQARPNIFKTSIANFLPGETVTVNLVYIEPLEYRKGMYEVNFPMVIGKRYIPLDSRSSADIANITPPVLNPSIKNSHRLDLTVSIDGIPVESVTSTTHLISVNESKGHYQIELADTIPNADFNLKIGLKRSLESQATLIEDTIHDTTYSMINIFPPTIKQENTIDIARDVIFLIDTSGSMSGESISQARSGLNKCLNMLDKNDAFSIVRFSSDHSFLSPNMLMADGNNIELAHEYIDGLSSGGGTAMQPALKHCLNIKGRPQAVRMLVFLTDGDVGNEDDLFRLINAKLDTTRLFTFGIGSAPNEYLMRKMAELGKGQSLFIHSHEDISLVMNDFFRTIAAPVMTDVNIKLYDNDENEITVFDMYPRRSPDLFYERPLRAYLKSKKTIKIVVISGQVDGKKVIGEYFVDKKKSNNHLINRLYGREAINELMYQYILAGEDQTIKATGEASNSDYLSNEIIKIALDHQLVSQFTSRIAVEEKISRSPEGTIVKVNVPNNLPRGWVTSEFSPTGTNDVLMTMIGLLLILTGIIFGQCRARKNAN